MTLELLSFIFIIKFLVQSNYIYLISFPVALSSLARLSKPKSTTHDFAQAIMKKLLKQKTYYPISVRSVGAAGTVCRRFCLISLLFVCVEISTKTKKTSLF